MNTKKTKKSPVAAVCSALGTALLILLIVICLPLTVPKAFHYHVYTVISGSMEPAIPTGSLVYIKEMEPKDVQVDDVIAFLNKMGADIRVGDKGQLIVQGKTSLHGAEHTVVADRIETGSYILAACATRGDVTVTGCVPEHNSILLEDLQEAGFTLDITEDSVRVHSYGGDIKPVRVRTAPYPGFATDLQAPWMTLMTLCTGTAEVDEDIFENRFMHAPELVRMGANISTEKSVARVTGVKELSAAHVQASDLRGGMALVIAGLCAAGETEVERVYHIDRGYEKLEEKLTALGADIRRYNPDKNEF